MPLIASLFLGLDMDEHFGNLRKPRQNGIFNSVGNAVSSAYGEFSIHDDVLFWE